MMKNLLLTSTAIAALSGGTANAADLVPKARPMAEPYITPSWQGFYVGAHLGVARMNTIANGAGTNAHVQPCAGAKYNASCAGSATGVAVGAEIGYDWQQGTFVYGVAADWTWTDLDHRHSTGDQGGSAWTNRQKIEWLASFRGRMGLAVQDTYVYVTGGIALAQLKARTELTFSGTTDVYGDLDKVKVGWVAGGGVEHRLTRNWSFKAEALYYDLGKEDGAVTNNGGSYTTTYHHEVMVGRVGLMYRGLFGW